MTHRTCTNSCQHAEYCYFYGCPFQRETNSVPRLAPFRSVSAFIGFQKDRLCSEANASRSSYGIQGDHERAYQFARAA